jgi:oxygen-dependent protoporphyrinogen oxidase
MIPAKRVVIIGGGVSGLSTAYRLSKLKPSVEIILLEASARFGGVIETSARDGFLLEGGPDSVLSEKAAAHELFKELGLEDEILGTSPQNRRSLIYQNGRLNPVPAGFYLFSPASLPALIGTPALSFSGKMRMAGELLIPALKSGEDESVSQFIRRRFGREALERIGQPMVGGIYMADPAHLSLQAVFPKFREMEKSHGSVIRALASRKKTENALAGASGPRYGLFLTLRGGMEKMTDALRSQMPGVQFLNSAAVQQVFPSRQKWKVVTSLGLFEADAVCSAAPAHPAAAFLESLNAELSRELRAISYESAVTVNAAYRREDIPHSLNAFGFVIPSREERKIAACSFSSIKFEGRAPEGRVLLRAFAGGAFGKEAGSWTDAELEKNVRDELRVVLGIQKAPLFISIRRFPKSMPQYHVGHLRRVERIEQLAQSHPGLFLTGNAYRGVGVADCIASANKTALEIHEYLEKQ